MPIRELIAQLEPQLPPAAIEAAQSLRYRDFLTIGLILRDKDRFTDNWIYIHDSSVQVGRVQNYKSWSPEMVPDPAFCCYGLEYFCFEGDGLWNSSDDTLLAMAKKEIQQIGLGSAEDVVDGCVIRQKKAYPVYDDAYQTHVSTIRQALAEHCPNLHLVGRNGMHKYNNQDHAMMTAMLAAREHCGGPRPVRRLGGEPGWRVPRGGKRRRAVQRAAAGARESRKKSRWHRMTDDPGVPEHRTLQTFDTAHLCLLARALNDERPAGPAFPPALPAAATAGPDRVPRLHRRHQLLHQALRHRQRHLVAPESRRLDGRTLRRPPHRHSVAHRRQPSLGGLQLGLRSADVVRLQVVRADGHRALRNAADHRRRLRGLLDAAPHVGALLGRAGAGGDYLLGIPVQRNAAARVLLHGAVLRDAGAAAGSQPHRPRRNRCTGCR